MNRHPGFWNLPGGQRFVRGIRRTERPKQSVVVHEPFDPSPLARAVEDVIVGEGLDEVCLLDGRQSAGSLPERLRGRFGGSASTPEGLAFEIRHAVLLAWDVEQADPLYADLQHFARSASSRREEAAPQVVLLSRTLGPGLTLPIWHARDTSGVIGPLDGATFAALAGETPDTLAGRLAAAVAIEVGAWDLDLIERIISAPIAHALRPDLDVARWADERLELWQGLPKAEWLTGSHDHWGGETCVHALFLAGNQPRLLERRVWRGQVSVLFPWLEERRQDVVQVYRSLLRKDPTSFDDEIDMLDWGSICHQLVKQPPVAVNYFHQARKLRNGLAHGRPVIWQDVKRCIESYDEWRAHAKRS